MALEQELATYRREVLRLVAEGHQGKYVLIQGNQVDSVWDTQDDALRAGYDRFGLEMRFLVKQIVEVEKIYYFSRMISPGSRLVQREIPVDNPWIRGAGMF